MQPRRIRYVLGRNDIHKVHNNCDPIEYITANGMRAEPSFRARLIEAACEKSFVGFEIDGVPVPVVLAPSEHYHVSGIIQELTPELTPVSLTRSEEGETMSSDLDHISDSNDSSSESSLSSNHDSSQLSTKQELNNNPDLIEHNLNATSIDFPAGSQLSVDSKLVKDEQLDSHLRLSSSSTALSGTTFFYNGISFKIDYEESAELALIGRLMTPSVFMKVLDLDKTYAKSPLQSAGIHKPQDIPLRIALELLPIIVSMLLADSRYFSDLLHSVDLATNNQVDQYQAKLVELLTNSIAEVKDGTGAKFHHALLTPPSSSALVSHTIKVLASLIYDVIGSERHISIYSIFKKIYQRSEDLATSRSAIFNAVPLEACYTTLENKKLVAQYAELIPWIVRSIIEVIFLQFYSLHEINLTEPTASVYSPSLKRMYNVCVFLLACLFIRQHYETRSTITTDDQHNLSSATPPHQDILFTLGVSLLASAQSWLKESPDEYRSSTQHVSTPGKLDKYMGEWGTVNLFLRSSLLQLVITNLTSGNGALAEPEADFFIQQSITLTKADASLANYYSSKYLDSSNLVGCLLGLTRRSLTIDSQRIIPIYLDLMGYFRTNSKCGGLLSEVISALLKFRYRRDSSELAKTGERLGKEMAYLYEKIRKPLMESKATAEAKVRKKTSSTSSPVFVCFLLMFISHIMLRINSVTSSPIHIFLQSWSDAALLLYPLVVYGFVSKYYGGRVTRLRIFQSPNLSYFATIYSDIYLHLENSVEAEPEVKKMVDAPSKCLTISLEEVKEAQVSAHLTATPASQEELKIYVHMNIPTQNDLSQASLVTSIPCQFALSEQLIIHCDTLSTLAF